MSGILESARPTNSRSSTMRRLPTFVHMWAHMREHSNQGLGSAQPNGHILIGVVLVSGVEAFLLCASNVLKLDRDSRGSPVLHSRVHHS